MAAPKQSPDLKIPPSDHTVSVSIIDTTLRLSGLPVAAFTSPEVGGYSTITGGIAYSFLIKHPSSGEASKYDKLLFDLGLRKDIENSPKVIVEQGKTFGFQMEVQKNVYEILKDGGDDPAEVGGIIWSHYHLVSNIRDIHIECKVDYKAGSHWESRHVSGIHRPNCRTRL